MNAAELARNPRLDTFFVRDLNVAPTGWALQDNSFDAVICCVRWALALFPVAKGWTGGRRHGVLTPKAAADARPTCAFYRGRPQS